MWLIQLVIDAAAVSVSFTCDTADATSNLEKETKTELKVTELPSDNEEFNKAKDSASGNYHTA